MGSQRKPASINRNRIPTPTATTRSIMEALERFTTLNIFKQRQNSRPLLSSHPTDKNSKSKKTENIETTKATRCHRRAPRPLQRSPRKLQPTRRRRRSNIYTTSKPDRSSSMDWWNGERWERNPSLHNKINIWLTKSMHRGKSMTPGDPRTISSLRTEHYGALATVLLLQCIWNTHRTSESERGKVKIHKDNSTQR